VLDPAQAEPDSHEAPHRSQICAAIVTYNIGDALHRCVDAIQSQVGHVLIVDNGSDEPTRSELDRLNASNPITVILNERNEGIARAFNQAVQWARGLGFQWILLLDHDSEATPGMVDELVRGYEALEQAGIGNVGVVGANPFDVNLQQYLLHGPCDRAKTPLEIQMEVISSGSLIPLPIFDKVGLFNEDLFIYYVDTEFCMRLSRQGFHIYLCPDAVMLHREGSKKRHRLLWWNTRYDHYGKTARYYLTRNLIYMIKSQTLPPGYIRGLLRSNWKDHLKILLFDEDRFGSLWFSLRGLVDGLKGKVGPLDSEGAGQPS
jgi:rhamnosyltransferase